MDWLRLRGSFKTKRLCTGLRRSHWAALRQPVCANPEASYNERSRQPFLVGGFFVCSAKRLLLARRQVRAAAMRHLGRHADAFAQRGVRVDGLADVHGVCAHLNR